MHIHISLAKQELQLFDDRELVASYTISSATNGIGSVEGSLCTPVGKFEIGDKIGAESEKGTIFKSRIPVGVWDGTVTDEDMVLTRIMRLNGLEEENANTFDRYIYIHGTTLEHRLGQPASCGCIHLSNDDVIDLFDRVDVGTSVVIEA
ncbi:L,D-transpeptidase [Oceaniferula spumae]|uniref:L,D-transpeptidase n=1 Tax=Oceaniferula spumae TaxID=2979115 RepID=A0AAT9FQ06_9BACT